MKTKKYLFALLLFFGIMFSVKANTYNVGEYVYYDPHNHKSCSINDYWTVYNQKSTCYRWVIIQTGLKEQSYDALRLLLDHDIGVSNFSDSKKIQSEVKQRWNDSNILKLTNLGNNMILDLYKGSYEKNSVWNKEKPTEVYYLKRARNNTLSFIHTNTAFYYNGKKYHDYSKPSSGDHKGGYWISHSDTDNDPFEDPETISKNSLAYYVNNSGYIQLSSIEDERGVRPTIYIKTSALSTTSYKSEEIKLEKVIANGKESTLKINYKANDNHIHENLSLNSNIYFYPQGFSFYDENNFLVYLTHRIRTEGNVSYNDTNSLGILLEYKDKSFKHVGNYDFTHGNDISIKPNGNFYISNNRDANIVGFDLENKKTIETIKDPWGTEFYYGAFTFDSNGEYFYGLDGNRRVFVRSVNNKYKTMYTFDVPILETLQTLAYNNGYLYIATYEVPKVNQNTECNTNYQLYCYGENRLTTIYVYNVKFDSNGKPSKFFGKLEKKYITNNINNIGNNYKLYYEIEGIGAVGNNLFLGYARTDSNYATPVAYPVVYSYPLTHRSLTYIKGNESKKDNIIDKSYIDLHNPFKYNSNEEFLGWKTSDGIVDASTIKLDKDINLNSIYTEFEKGTSLDKNIIKTGLKKEIGSFNSKNFCHNCKFNLPSNKKYIGTGDKIGIYVDNKKIKDYEVIIKGDVTGTGTSTVTDVAKLYQYMKKKIDMEDCYKEAGNVVGTDNEIKINDVAKLYQFIKGKISGLEE